MTDGPVVFSSAVEGFARSFASRMSPELLSEAKALGVDFANILPAYPLEIWEALMQKVGDALYADIPPERRFRKMGQDFLQGYAETLIGKAVITTARVLGPRRTLERMARNFQTATNYIASEAQVLGDRQVSVTTWMYPQFLDAWRGRPTVMLDYRHGILDQVLAVLGVQSPQVEFAELDLQRQLARYCQRAASGDFTRAGRVIIFARASQADAGGDTVAKVTRQSSGVVGGAVDVSRRTTVKSPQTPAGSALARRKQAGLRGKKAVAQTKSAPRRVTKKKAPSRRR